MGQLKLRLLYYNLSFTAFTSPLLMIIALATNYWLYSTEMVKETKIAKATTEYYTVPIQTMTTTNFLLNRNMILTSGTTTPPLSLWSKPSYTLYTYAGGNRNTGGGGGGGGRTQPNRTFLNSSSLATSISSPAVPAIALTKFTSIFKKKIEFALTSTHSSLTSSTNKASTTTMPTMTTHETSSTTPPIDYIVAYYGLWRVCKIIDANKRLDCDYIKYFQGSESENRITDTIKKQIGNCTIPILLSLLLMVISVGFHTYALFHRKLRHVFLLSGCLFIFAGLASLTGLVIFIATVNGAVDNKLTLNKSKEDEPPFVYHYDWSFFCAVLSFLIQELNGISNVYWYIDYYRKYRFKFKEKHEKEKIARKLLKKRRKPSSKMSTSSTLSINSQVPAANFSPNSRAKKLSVPKIKITASTNDIEKLEDQPHVLGKETPGGRKRLPGSSAAPNKIDVKAAKEKKNNSSISSGSNASSTVSGTKSYLRKIREKTGGIFGPNVKSSKRDEMKIDDNPNAPSIKPPPLPAMIGFNLDEMFDPPKSMPEKPSKPVESCESKREEKKEETAAAGNNNAKASHDKPALSTPTAAEAGYQSEDDPFSTPSQVPNDMLLSEADFMQKRAQLNLTLENNNPLTVKTGQPKMYTVNYLKQKNRLKQQQKQEQQQMSTPERNAQTSQAVDTGQDEGLYEDEAFEPDRLLQGDSEAMFNYNYPSLYNMGGNPSHQYPSSYYKLNQMVSLMFQPPSPSPHVSPASTSHGMVSQKTAMNPITGQISRSQLQYSNQTEPMQHQYQPHHHHNRALPDYADIMMKQQQHQQRLQGHAISTANTNAMFTPSMMMPGGGDGSSMLVNIHDATSSTACGSTSCASTTGSNSSSSSSSSTTSYSGSSQSTSRSSTPTNQTPGFHHHQASQQQQHFVQHETAPTDKRRHRMNSFKMKMAPFNTIVNEEYPTEEMSDSVHSQKHRHGHHKNRHSQEATGLQDKSSHHERRRHRQNQSNLDSEMALGSEQLQPRPPYLGSELYQLSSDEKEEADRLEFAKLLNQFNKNANTYEKIKYTFKNQQPLDEDTTSDERTRNKIRYEFMRQLSSAEDFYPPQEHQSSSHGEPSVHQRRRHFGKIPKTYYYSQDSGYGYRPSSDPTNFLASNSSAPLGLRLSKTDVQEGDEQTKNARLANQTLSPIAPLAKEMTKTSLTTTTTTSFVKEHHQSSTYSPPGASSATPTHHKLPIIHMDPKNSGSESVRLKINTGHDNTLRSGDTMPMMSSLKSQTSPTSTASQACGASSQPPQSLLLIEKTFPIYNSQSSHQKYIPLLQKASPITSDNRMTLNSSSLARKDTRQPHYTDTSENTPAHYGGTHHRHHHHHHHHHQRPPFYHLPPPPPYQQPIHLVPSSELIQAGRPVLQRASTLDYQPVTRYVIDEFGYENYPQFYQGAYSQTPTDYPDRHEPPYAFNYDNLDAQAKLSKSTTGVMHASRRPFSPEGVDQESPPAASRTASKAPKSERKNLKRTTSV